MVRGSIPTEEGPVQRMCIYVLAYRYIELSMYIYTDIDLCTCIYVQLHVHSVS